eukprot:2683564-Pyramimonas_sp.AAC.1
MIGHARSDGGEQVLANSTMQGAATARSLTPVTLRRHQQLLRVTPEEQVLAVDRPLRRRLDG